MARKKSELIVLCCENSAYLVAESISENKIMRAVKVVKLPCSGKVEVGLMLKYLENGAPGVLVLGCPLDNCKFIRGNYRAQKRIDVVKKALKDAGVNEGRVRMDFISSLDTYKFLAIVQEMKNNLF